MNISFKKVTPSPLDGVTDLQTEIWGKDFEFVTDQHIKIFAPSGKGKSSFMHLLYGLRNDYKGSIYIDGKDIKTFSAQTWATVRQEKISLLFQDLRLFLDLTALENIKLKYELKSFKDWNSLESLFERLNIAHVKNKPCAHLSYGERQRVAIIRALVQPFEILLLDEPFSHLDRNNAETASELIQEECRARKAHYIYTSLGSDVYLNETKAFRL
jgi:ABC-type lipoprotein export system ATPase subunit